MDKSQCSPLSPISRLLTDNSGMRVVFRSQGAFYGRALQTIRRNRPYLRVQATIQGLALGTLNPVHTFLLRTWSGDMDRRHHLNGTCRIPIETRASSPCVVPRLVHVRNGSIAALDIPARDVSSAARILERHRLKAGRIDAHSGSSVHFVPVAGRLAQRESTAFTRQGSLVRTQHRPPVKLKRPVR